MSESRSQQPAIWWTTQRARTLALAAWIAIAFVAACGGDTSTGPVVSKSPVGNYTVATINGQTLPFTMFSDTSGYKYEETAGTLALTSDGRYSFVTTYRQTVQTDVETFVDSTSGTWTQTGATVRFVDALDTTATAAATWAAPQLTFTDSTSGLRVVYHIAP